MAHSDILFNDFEFFPDITFIVCMYSPWNAYLLSGHKYKCLLDIVPIKNEKSQVVLVLVSHKDIGHKEKAEESDDDDKSSSEMDSDGKVLYTYWYHLCYNYVI